MNYRTLVLFLVCALILGPGSVHAQESGNAQELRNKQERRNAISVDVLLPVLSPIAPLSGEDDAFVPLNIKYQRLLAEHWVLMVKMGLTYSWDSAGQKIVEVNPMLGLDWHPFNTGLEGFYLGPSLFYNNNSYFYSGTPATSDLDHSYWASAGGHIGYVFVLKSGMVIDLIFGLGAGYSKEVHVKGRGGASGFQFDETIGGVFLGYAF